MELKATEELLGFSRHANPTKKLRKPPVVYSPPGGMSNGARVLFFKFKQEPKQFLRLRTNEIDICAEMTPADDQLLVESSWRVLKLLPGLPVSRTRSPTSTVIGCSRVRRGFPIYMFHYSANRAEEEEEEVSASSHLRPRWCDPTNRSGHHLPGASRQLIFSYKRRFPEMKIPNQTVTYMYIIAYIQVFIWTH